MQFLTGQAHLSCARNPGFLLDSFWDWTTHWFNLTSKPLRSSGPLAWRFVSARRRHWRSPRCGRPSGRGRSSSATCSVFCRTHRSEIIRLLRQQVEYSFLLSTETRGHAGRWQPRTTPFSLFFLFSFFSFFLFLLFLFFLLFSPFFFENNGPRANARPPANSDSKEKAWNERVKQLFLLRCWKGKETLKLKNKIEMFFVSVENTCFLPYFIRMFPNRAGD